MRKLNLYSFHKGIAPYRFDDNNTRALLQELEKKYQVAWYEYNGGDGFKYQSVTVDQGSILIFEFDDTKEFKTFDFGDAPTITLKLSRSDKFIGAAIGQYNKTLWDESIQDPKLRVNIKPSIYPETCWQFGLTNYQDVKAFREQTDLDTRLYWRGSIYKDPNRVEYDRRIAIEYVAQTLDTFYFGHYPIPFDHYIQEAIQFKLALCSGVGGGYACGDFCLRDIELYGLGIPTIRPVYAAETEDPLIANVHYIGVECEFDPEFRYKNPDQLAKKIISRYKEVINDDDYLKEVADNAHQWYVNNITTPNITNKILKALDL